MLRAEQNQVCEITMISRKTYSDPFNDVGVYAVIVDPSGATRRVSAFWGGGNCWKIRYSSHLCGVHSYQTFCSDESNPDLHGKSGQIEMIPLSEDNHNPLYRHGAIRKNSGGRYLEHADGAPFFWLADTWWMGLTTRLAWPEDFIRLTKDRVEKGFTVIQIVAGLYPDMDPFDPRGKNEAGYPWDREFIRINPEYFDAAEKKLFHLIEQGIAPCIVGCWGFFSKYAGVETIKKHWDYILARWAAYPVIWCAAGEAVMPFYNDGDILSGRMTREEYIQAARRDWTEITRHIRASDPFKRLITIHPTTNGHEQMEDETLLDLDMLQTGHSGPISLLPTLKQVKAAVDRKKMPVINGEVCYEGICGSSGADVQRYLFWSCVMTGCCGHTYGANGIWQLNDRLTPYGPSPHGAGWGDTPWQEAADLPGSRQIGDSKKFLMQFEWWRLEPHPEWIEKPCDYESLEGYFCVGIPGELRLIFRPFFGGAFWGEDLVKNVEPDTYTAKCYYVFSNRVQELGDVRPDEKGNWIAPRVNAFGDTVLVLEKKK